MIATAVILAVLLAVVVLAVRSLFRSKGSCSCGSGCSHCAMSEQCHSDRH